jgi:NADPH:quinone reductase-like Zn-dependent oxidoreductase
MLAIYQPQYGMPGSLKLMHVPKPAPKAGQVLIRVHAACLNSWDWDRLTGQPLAWRLLSGIRSPRQRIPGCDLAGVVEAVGPGVLRLKPGDAVMGDLSAAGAWGAFAEYAVAPESVLAIKHANLSFEEAACLPQAGMLALQSIRDSLNLQSGQSLLISGAGGGVGTLALQMAKARGAVVTVCDRAEKLPALLSLGADEALPWPNPGCYGQGRTWDRILDVQISLPMVNYVDALAPGGILAFIGGGPGALLRAVAWGKRLAKKQGKAFSLVAQKTTVADLEELMRMAVHGQAKPVIDSVYALENAVQAFERFGEGRFIGKVVIQPTLKST